MNQVIFLMGPTASGKTELVVRLAQELPIDIISVDSVMVYKGLDIGTAKPDAAMQALAPHALIDTCEPSESYSASRFCQDAQNEIEKSHNKGRIPILVGGTFLYFKALQHGISPLPSADEVIRKQLCRDGDQLGWQAMHRRLQEVDPLSATRIHPNDPQRIQRALEVYLISGEPMSTLIGKYPLQKLPYPVRKIVVATHDRANLRAKIAKRFIEMLNQGLVAEVEALYDRKDLHAELPAIRAVGYRQVWQYLEGKIDKNTMQERAITATRQFAKRQFTWLRSESDGDWLEATSTTIYHEVLKKLRSDTIL
ncbi:MAG: tRNA (adenosine(37)-N6)-dimethylallyltransferase MiaA [Thiohalomonadales bacterium]